LKSLCLDDVAHFLRQRDPQFIVVCTDAFPQLDSRKLADLNDS